MKVHELIAWLQGFEDQDAVVEVIVHTRGTGHYDQGGNVTQAPFNPEEHAEYVDMRGNPYTPEDAPYYNSRTLLLGARDG